MNTAIIMDMMFNTEMIVKDMKGGKEDMTEKRFNRVGGYVYDGDKCISHFEDVAHRDDIVKLLNELHEENQELKQQLQNTSDQRDEFHRGARENANRVGKLEKENEQLRHDATILIQSNQDYRKENEELKQQLTDCEKFRHTVFQQINQEMMKQ